MLGEKIFSSHPTSIHGHCLANRVEIGVCPCEVLRWSSSETIFSARVDLPAPEYPIIAIFIFYLFLFEDKKQPLWTVSYLASLAERRALSRLALFL